MSQAGNELSYAQAEALITRLSIALDIKNTCQQFTVCGSFRRGRATINDIDIVAIPKHEVRVALNPKIHQDSFFEDPDPVIGTALEDSHNLLNERLDALLADGTIKQALYGDTQVTRWGDKLRGFIFDGIKVEIDQTDERGFGVKCLIRTGSADFSRSIVTLIKKRGVHRVYGGYLRPWHGDDLKQKEKDALPIIPCPSEKDVFDAAGKLWMPPSMREEELR